MVSCTSRIRSLPLPSIGSCRPRTGGYGAASGAARSNVCLRGCRVAERLFRHRLRRPGLLARPRHTLRRHRRRCFFDCCSRFLFGRRNTTSVGEEPTRDRRTFRSRRIATVRRRPRRTPRHLRESRGSRRQDENGQAERPRTRQRPLLAPHVMSLIANYGAMMLGRFELSEVTYPDLRSSFDCLVRHPHRGGVRHPLRSAASSGRCGLGGITGKRLASSPSHPISAMWMGDRGCTGAHCVNRDPRVRPPSFGSMRDQAGGADAAISPCRRPPHGPS